MARSNRTQLVKPRGTRMEQGYDEAREMGMGVMPGGASESTKKLVAGTQGGLANPFQQIGDWFKSMKKKRK